MAVVRRGTTRWQRRDDAQPLGYRTRIRLQEARRLMLVEDRDVTTIGVAVGYGSASQFSREYRRQFGAAPAGDAVGVRRDAGGRAA